jgi:uncharacterized protein YjbI with pentapeptide repeats
MANEEHLAQLKQGVEVWNQWRASNPAIKPNLAGADLAEANLVRASLRKATLIRADLREADLSQANLFGMNFQEAKLAQTDLGGANLTSTLLVETNLEEANLTGCSVYGMAAWNVHLGGAQQSDLIISRDNEPMITVDNLEVAQFIYLLLHNEKIREVIDTIGKKGVLILGQRDFTETIMTLAGLSLFVIADITNPRSAPLELQAAVPDYMIPFVPIIAEGEEPFAMFIDLQRKFDWVLEVLTYDSVYRLLEGLDAAVIAPALQIHERVVQRRTRVVGTRHIQQYLPHGDARP